MEPYYAFQRLRMPFLSPLGAARGRFGEQSPNPAFNANRRGLTQAFGALSPFLVNSKAQRSEWPPQPSNLAPVGELDAHNALVHRTIDCRSCHRLRNYLPRCCAAAEPDLDHDRWYGRRVLPAWGWDGQHSVEIRSGASGNRRSDRGFRRQPEAARCRQIRSRVYDGGRLVGCLQRRRQVQGGKGQRTDPDGALPEPHADRHRGRNRNNQARRPQGQARLHRSVR